MTAEEFKIQQFVMPQLGKALVCMCALLTITQLNGIYLWELPPRKYGLGSKG